MSNPFEKTERSIPEIEDVDDSTFLNHPRQGYVLGSGGGSGNDPAMDKRMQLLQERKAIEERTLQSTKNSLALIYETEKVGMSTAEELLHQREQLENTNEKLDSINSIMRVSQKHLKSMKSMFGGLFSRNSDKANNGLPPKSEKKLSTSASDNKLPETIEKLSAHSSMINDTRVKYKLSQQDDSNEIDTVNKNNLSSYELHSKQVDRQLDNNLAEMGLGISRLKELALGLGNEIESQNKLLDTLAVKSEKAQDTINNQNRQMNRILKS